jgi:undecaprenyl diphosphate synthase
MINAVPLPSEKPRSPRHVAIIMDGNGRWARGRGLRRIAGHKRGAEAVKTAVECAAEFGIDYLTLFGFSSENWKRPEDEVSDLMGLLRFYLSSEVQFLEERGVRFRMIGDRTRLAPDIVRLIEQTEARTAGNSRLNLVLALSYGGRAEIADAARRLAELAVAGQLDPAVIDERLMAEFLYTSAIPDPDLVIRTSGEKRISNFLLWQSAYSELIFIDALWPDFSRRDFNEALEEFHRRERRYGTAVA